ncbi:NAD(P)H-quinone dehydrogenase [Bailinhaonella thermotolerans]|uniref:NAD(P)H dehydrogenase (quinone) n=1 Tax=Bailinhaonella thermotolerans TaxID=1070861 RepID=A0A3A4B6C6_9ACTN|nr:NAD(P)H-quinone dehydrogenase [Bailinhaonella thermotolerans]RJL33581.1 NAD(P)H-quinone dehydrogenase [Bailinhaonella thermotolerans]
MSRIVIIGGGPGGYEAALMAAQLGAQVTVVEQDGPGGACVLTDCVPSKTLIATSVRRQALVDAQGLGVHYTGGPDGDVGGIQVDLPLVNKRVKELARAQSADIAARLAAEGVEVVRAAGRLVDPQVVRAGDRTIRADVVIVATGATPRILPGAEPDGERILTWRQLYDLEELPERLIVVGSGVTGAEFAGAYRSLGSDVTLVSSRDRMMPNEDADGAEVLEEVYRRRGMKVMGRSRAKSVERTADGVRVTLEDGRVAEGTHCLMTVGMIPNTHGIGLEEAGVHLDKHGFIQVDKVSRTSAPGVYAAGDCTGVLMLASVAAMQGRIAVWHAMGEAVQPLRLPTVASTVFTDPEIAAVGVSHNQVMSGEVPANVVKLPLNTNPRAKMHGFEDGFIKLFCRPHTGIILGGVIVAPRASELILAVSLAVQQRLTVDQMAHTFSVYPSLSGSITEAARRLMQPLVTL